MMWYRWHDLTLEVRYTEPALGGALAPLLHDVSCVHAPAGPEQPRLCLTIRGQAQQPGLPSVARRVLHTEGFDGFVYDSDFYLTDGASLFHLQAPTGRGDAYLAPDFVHKPLLLQRNFWAFGLLRLLRPLGLFSLHAAGVVTEDGLGLLIVGEAGSGKSTLALGLIRHGWGYLSDDAVLLRQQPQGIEALTLRRYFYVNADAAAAYDDFSLGEVVPDTTQGWRQRVDIQATHAQQAVAGCVPGVLLCARLVSQPHSTLRPLDHPSALRYLLAQSGPQLFDRHTMPQHLEVLKHLVQQTTAYELSAGLDLYQHPITLARLLEEAAGKGPWRALSSS